jgi:response regulator of citrate/malate metabolism
MKTEIMTEKIPSWSEGMDASERVHHVILTRTTPQNAGWIAEEADVSRDTAVKYLTRMVEQDELKEIETDN